MLTPPRMGEAGVGEPSFRRAGHDQPLMVLIDFGRGEHQLTVGIGELGKVRGQDLPLRLVRGDLFLTPAEELDVRLGDRQAGDRVRHEVQRLPIERFADECGVRQPDDNAADVAVLHRPGHEVGPRLLQWRGDLDQAVVVVGLRFQVQCPVRHLRAEVLRLILGDELVADVLNVGPLPVDLTGCCLQVGLHVVQQLVDVDRVCFQRDLLAVAIPQIDGRSLAGRHDLQVLKAAPVLHDLIDTLLAMVLVTKLGERALPGGGRLHILTTVFIRLSHHVAGALRVLVVAALEDLLEDLERVEFIGQLQPADSRRQLGDGFIIAERVHRERSAVILVVVASAAAAQPGHRLHAELIVQKMSPRRVRFIAQPVVSFDPLQQHPAPAFPVGGGGLPRLGDAVKDRLAVRIDGCSLAVSTPTPSAKKTTTPELISFFVVGQRRQIGERLHSPRFIPLQRAGHLQKEPADFRLVGVLNGEGERLLHQLQRPHSVTGGRRDILPAATMRAPLILAGDDEAPLVDPAVLLGRAAQQPPILFVRLDRRLDQFIELVGPSEIPQRLHSECQIGGHLLRIGHRIKSEFSVAVVGQIEVSRIEPLLCLVAIHRLAPFLRHQPPGRRDHRHQAGQNNVLPHDVNPFLASKMNRSRPKCAAEYSVARSDTKPTGNGTPAVRE